MRDNSKDELILDIMEKTYDQVQTIQKDVVEIKVQQAVHDQVVREHEARSTASENRLALVEDKLLELIRQRDMINGGVKLIVGLAAIITFVLKVLPLFVH